MTNPFFLELLAKGLENEELLLLSSSIPPTLCPRWLIF